MAKNSNLKLIAVIGGLLGLIAVLIGLVPSEISWWYVKETVGNNAAYLNAFGYFTDMNGEVEFIDDYLILLSGVIFLISSIMIMYGGVKGQQGIAIISGVLMIVGLVLFCVALNANEDWGNVESFLSWLDNESTVFYGEWLVWRWGLGVGFYLGAVGAGIGIIGAVVMNK